RARGETLAVHVGDERVNVVAHQIKLVDVILLGGVHRHFCGWQREDQPAVTGVGVAVLQNVAEEGAVGVGVLAVEDDVSSMDHDAQGTRGLAATGTSAKRGVQTPAATWMSLKSVR